MKRALRLLAPYFAVVIFWCIFSNAWLAILGYHAQAILWSRRTLSDLRRPHQWQVLWLALPAIAAGPLLYWLLPYITRVELSLWLTNHHLSNFSLLLMIPYFGIIHPLLEQLHWKQLREETPIAHFMFAGYHMLVLHSLLTVPWMILCFVVLTISSFLWQLMTAKSNSLAAPVLSHVLADLGIIIAAWLSTH